MSARSNAASLRPGPAARRASARRGGVGGRVPGRLGGGEVEHGAEHQRNAGGFCAYITQGLGRPAGFGAALLALLALLGYLGMNIGVFGLLGSATRDTVQALTGHDVPWLLPALIGLLVIWYGGFRSIDFGATLALGSDWPIAHHDPRGVLAYAQLRRHAGTGTAPVNPGQAFAALMALEGYTTHAARAAGESVHTGRIAPGLRADLTAFALDPLTADPDAFAETAVPLTTFNGVVTNRGAG